MRYRQVHLDFHTSEKIPDVGAGFTKENFQEALKKGHVDSITLFSKCHHGWAYHPSKTNEMHPNLHFDLLGAQISAAHEIGVKTPVYLSAGLDEKMARRHPEWLIRRRDESTTWAKDFSEPGYHRMCFNSPYLDYLLAQIREVCENYDADGIFLDIVGVIPCYCQNCVRILREEGKDPYDEAAVYDLAERTYASYARRVRETVDQVKPGLPVFHNSGHVRRGRRDLAYFNSHLELESLPTGGWGYDHFPLSAAYARTLGMDVIGMTGKFHRSWGEFGGFKHPNALRYETALSVASGAGCSVGDQLHPGGRMDLTTYELIGEAYRELEEKEPWLRGACNLADTAVFTVESAQNYYRDKGFGTGQSTQVGASDAGCTRILLEGGYLFDAIDEQAEFEKYKVIILPDKVQLDKKLKEKFDRFLDHGGKVLLSGRSGLWQDEKEGFALDLGIRYLGEHGYSPTYARPEFDVPPFGKTSFLMHGTAQKFECISARKTVSVEHPYFNRTVEHFTSHAHAPGDGKDAGPGIAVSQKGVYICWDIFRNYGEDGSLICKKLVCHVLDELLGEKKSVTTTLPAQGIVTLTRQNERLILHLLYASPVRRGNGVEVIEDILPVCDIQAEVKTEMKVADVIMEPQHRKLEFEQKGEKVRFCVPHLENHQMIVLEPEKAEGGKQ
ncbi:MAG TPA: beta-galactosidase trimerization domain-containing protein [Candidatus Mediterraneibacter cottocaccae]|nr:beta-galactosidase trimerization domain-containing protein [Candidatus Mediterraneibacter cottocaccae]